MEKNIFSLVFMSLYISSISLFPFGKRFLLSNVKLHFVKPLCISWVCSCFAHFTLDRCTVNEIACGYIFTYIMKDVIFSLLIFLMWIRYLAYFRRRDNKPFPPHSLAVLIFLSKLTSLVWNLANKTGLFPWSSLRSLLGWQTSKLRHWTPSNLENVACRQIQSASTCSKDNLLPDTYPTLLIVVKQCATSHSASQQLEKLHTKILVLHPKSLIHSESWIFSALDVFLQGCQ